MVTNLSGGGVEESKTSQQQPCLLITDGENCRIQTNMFNDKPQLVYDVGGEIPEFLGGYIDGSFGEWVLLVGSSDHILVNLLSKEIIELPSSDFKYDFCTITSHPYDPTCHIVYFNEEENSLTFCQPGDKEFTIRKWDYETFPTQAVVVAGKLILYLQNSPMDTLGIIEFKESTYRFEAVRMDCKSRNAFYGDIFLFEYSGELFVVCKVLRIWSPGSLIGFEIFKADFLNKKLVSVKNLGGVAIFIGDETVHTLCASVESGIAGNSIYYLEDDDDSYYIYNLKEGSIRFKSAFSFMEMNTTVSPQLDWVVMSCDDASSFSKLLKGDQESVCHDSEQENKASTVEVEEVWVQNSWNTVPPELLNLIQSGLFGRDHAVFRLVCKAWQQVSIPPLLSWTTLLELCQSSSPLLMFQEDITISCDSVPTFRFFDPVHKKLYRTGIPELRGTDIQCSKDGWLLVSRRSDESIFFLNPLTQEKIELPRMPGSYFRALYYTLSFSSPPTSSNCLVVVMQNTLMYTLRHGEKTWRKVLFEAEFETEYEKEYGDCPVVLNGLHHFMFQNGDVVVFNLMDGAESGEGLFADSQIWPSKLKREPGNDFFLEIDGALALVDVEGDEEADVGISILKWNDLKRDWELMEGVVDFGGKEMFLSRRGGSFMEKIDDGGGMGNAIFLRMIDDDAKEGVFYSLATRRYHTFYSGYSSELPYNVDIFLNGVWVKPDRKTVGEHNLKWFV